jgi:hypothetical protein
VSAWHPVRVGDAVVPKTLAEILRFADVKHHIVCVPHEIDAGALRQSAEEFSAEPLDERLRVWKKKLLCRKHTSIEHERPGECQWQPKRTLQEMSGQATRLF